jgi:biotin carboxyl carrier protein
VQLLDGDAFCEMKHDLATAETVRLPHAAPGPDLALVARAALPTQVTASAWTAAGPYRATAPARVVYHGAGAETWQQAVWFGLPRSGWDVATGSTDPLDDPRPSAGRRGAVVLENDGATELATPFGRWLVKLGPLPRESAAGVRADGVLRAPMPGMVVAVNVAVGQRVRKDEVLAVMTAMKMELALAAPFDGVVATVGAAPGELVGTQQALVTVTPEEAAGDARDE